MAKWMSSKGARNIVLTSRNASGNKKVLQLAEELAERGTKIVVHSCDVSSRGSVRHLVEDGLRDLPPIRGVINAAMFLKVSWIAFGLPLTWN